MNKLFKKNETLEERKERLKRDIENAKDELLKLKSKPKTLFAVKQGNSSKKIKIEEMLNYLLNKILIAPEEKMDIIEEEIIRVIGIINEQKNKEQREPDIEEPKKKEKKEVYNKNKIIESKKRQPPTKKKSR